MIDMLCSRVISAYHSVASPFIECIAYVRFGFGSELGGGGVCTPNEIVILCMNMGHYHRHPPHVLLDEMSR